MLVRCKLGSRGRKIDIGVAQKRSCFSDSFGKAKGNQLPRGNPKCEKHLYKTRRYNHKLSKAPFHGPVNKGTLIAKPDKKASSKPEAWLRNLSGSFLFLVVFWIGHVQSIFLFPLPLFLPRVANPHGTANASKELLAPNVWYVQTALAS